MRLTKEQHKEIQESLKKDGRVNIRNIGTFLLKNSRKGRINLPHVSETIFEKSVAFKLSRKFKEKINEHFK